MALDRDGRSAGAPGWERELGGFMLERREHNESRLGQKELESCRLQ